MGLATPGQRCRRAALAPPQHVLLCIIAIQNHYAGRGGARRPLDQPSRCHRHPPRAAAGEPPSPAAPAAGCKRRQRPDQPAAPLHAVHSPAPAHRPRAAGPRHTFWPLRLRPCHTPQTTDLDVAVIGGGPGGLAAAKAILTARQEAGALLRVVSPPRLPCILRSILRCTLLATATRPPHAWCNFGYLASTLQARPAGGSV